MRRGLGAVTSWSGDLQTRESVRALLLFGVVFWLQIGHLIEHLSLAFAGRALLGPEADSQLTHFAFNVAIGILSVLLVIRYPHNPWVIPLAAIALLHMAEDSYNYIQFVETAGKLNGPAASVGAGLLGSAGRLEVFPIEQVDLHNAFNGLEWILIVLGLAHEIDAVTTPSAAGSASLSRTGR